MYFGDLFTLFCAHTENFNLWSQNVLISGDSKIWIGIDLRDSAKFREAINELVPHEHKKCFNVHQHKHFIVSTEWLKKHGIRYRIVSFFYR